MTWTPQAIHPWRKQAAVEASTAPRKPRQPVRHIEDGECMALMSWAAVRNYRNRPVADLLIHYPAGGKRNAREAARLRRMGVRAGVPDYFLHVPREGFGGLWVEMKRAKAPGVKAGETSAAQDAQLQLLIGLGYRCEVAHGWQAAADIIADYLGLKRAAR